MAADMSSTREQMKPCCVLWKEKYTKLEERRNALRQAVKLLEQQADKLQLENINLKKANEEAQSHSKIEREERAKQFDVFTTQEKEISLLKSEVISLKQRKGSSFEDVDKKLLQERICESEKEITKLKDLLKKEKKKAVAEKENTPQQGRNLPSDDAEKSMLRVRISDCEGEINKLIELLEIEKLKTEAEKKAATAEKNRASAACKMLKEEKSKANNERLETESEKKKAEENQTLLESLKKELDDTRLKLATEASKVQQCKKKLESERQMTAKQKNNADKARMETEEQKQIADLNCKLALEEKQRAERLDKQLAEEKLGVDGLLKEIHQLQSSMKAFETFSPETEKKDPCKAKTETVCKKVKSRNMNVKEGKQGDETMAVSVITETPKTEISKLESSRSSASKLLHDESHGVSGSERIKFLKKQLKFEKLQAKHATKTANLEKDRTDVLCRELNFLKQEFIQFLYRMDILESHYSLDTEGIHDFSKIPLQARSLQNTRCADPTKSHQRKLATTAFLWELHQSRYC